MRPLSDQIDFRAAGLCAAKPHFSWHQAHVSSNSKSEQLKRNTLNSGVDRAEVSQDAIGRAIQLSLEICRDVSQFETIDERDIEF